MDITIIASGTRGDVQPFVGLAKGLISAGYRVRLVSDLIFEDLVSGAGVEFFPIPGYAAYLKDGLEDILRPNRRSIKAVPKLMNMLHEVFSQQGKGIWESCQDTQAVISHSTLTPHGHSAAQKLGLPFIECGLIPLVPTEQFPSPPLHRYIYRSLPGALNRFTHLLTDQFIWQLRRREVNQWRTESLEMPPYHFRGHFSTVANEGIPRLEGYSRHVVPRAADWDRRIFITGFWFLDADMDWKPPAGLVDFLNSGPPPVYIGFGSQILGDAARRTEIVLEALDRSKQRGVLMTGWGAVEHACGDNVYTANSLPHSWLFPCMAAVVHAGGAGTTAAGMRAGIPNVIVPFLVDQFYWGRRAKHLGVSPMPIPQKTLSAGSLAEAIREAVGNADMRKRAVKLGEKIRAEGGVGRAVRFIDRFLDNTGSTAQLIPRKMMEGY